MTRFLLNTLVLACLYCSTAYAQQRKLTIEDAVLRQRSTLAPNRLAQAAFIPGTSILWWVANSGPQEMIVYYTIDTKRTDSILPLRKFAEMIESSLLNLPKPERFPAIRFLDKDNFRFMYQNVYFNYTITLNKLTVVNRILAGSEGAEIDVATGNIAFSYYNNAVLFKPGDYDSFVSGSKQNSDGASGSKPFFLSNDGNAFIENGKSVHRNEFGISKGLFWSQNGKKLAFYKQMQYDVTDYPLLKLGETPMRTETIKYPMAGGRSQQVYVYIHNLEKNLTYPVLTTGDPDQYITNITFSPDGDQLYIAIVNRNQDYMQLNRYDANTGAFVKTLFTEESTRYVEPEKPVMFLKNERGKFLWLSERDGYTHLYLYKYTGEMEKQLTTGNYDVTEVIGFDEKGDHIYFIATANNGLDRHVMRVEWNTGAVVPVCNQPGVHSAVVSDDGKYIYDTYTSIQQPRVSRIVDGKGKEIAYLLRSENPLLAYQKCDVRIFQIKAADGKTDLNCRMIYPFRIDSAQKKYPVLVYVYGGPHAQMITNSFLGGADYWLYYMAQQGYLVFTVDNRGSANRGIEFEQSTFGQLGKVELFDQLMGLQYISGLKYADTSRMGVYGWSFGGFMTLNMMTRTPYFKAGVAGGPVTDWRLYEVMYTERYMNTPQQNPEGYEQSNTLSYIKNLKGKLLLIHGMDDDVVVWQQSLNYVRKAIDDGVQLDYFVYPGHKHNVVGKDRVHLMQKITDYMNLHVK